MQEACIHAVCVCVAAMLLPPAGATIVGKTHMSELAYSLDGNNAHYGTPLNAAAPGRNTGGSSSGSAVSCQLLVSARGGGVAAVNWVSAGCYQLHNSRCWPQLGLAGSLQQGLPYYKHQVARPGANTVSCCCVAPCRQLLPQARLTLALAATLVVQSVCRPAIVGCMGCGLRGAASH